MLTKEVQILDAASNLLLEEKTSEDQELMTSMAEKGNNKNKTWISLDMEEVEVMSSTYVHVDGVQIPDCMIDEHPTACQHRKLFGNTRLKQRLRCRQTSSQGRLEMSACEI